MSGDTDARMYYNAQIYGNKYKSLATDSKGSTFDIPIAAKQNTENIQNLRLVSAVNTELCVSL